MKINLIKDKRLILLPSFSSVWGAPRMRGVYRPLRAQLEGSLLQSLLGSIHQDFRYRYDDWST